MNKLIKNSNILDGIRRFDEFGNEYFYAKELMNILGYVNWKKFIYVVIKSKKCIKTIDGNISDHFECVYRIANINNKIKRRIDDYKLSRFACYLIIQNADSNYDNVALAQNYIIQKTRLMEKTEENNVENATRIFCASLLEERLKRENIKDAKETNKIRDEINKQVRKTFSNY